MKIKGYDYGKVEQSPVTLEDLEKIKAVVGFTSDDEKYLRKAGDVLEDQIEDLLDLWYGFVGSVPHLLYYFTGTNGEPLQDYLESVRKRFGQWVLDTCKRELDQDWLNYQHEIGLRHHRTKKNQTDGVKAPVHIPLRYLVALTAPIILTVKPFFSKKGDSHEEVEKMHTAWIKSVIMQLALWSHPYTKEDDW